MHSAALLTIAALAGTSLAAPGWTDNKGQYGSYAPYADYGSYGKPAPPPPAPSPTHPAPGIPSDVASVDVTFYAGLDCTGGITKQVVGLVVDDESVCRDDGVPFKSYKITRIDKELTGAALSPNSVWGFQAGVLKDGVSCDFTNNGIVQLNEADTLTKCISPAIPDGHLAAREYHLVEVILH